jgi:hypothetical protein
MHHITYTTAERKLAWLARKLATNRDVLYHGTRYRQSILKMEVLFRPPVGVPVVCLTRSPEVAAYWALLKRDNDEGRGSIFVFDRQCLASRYEITCSPEVYWHSDTTFHDEAEEQIFEDVTKIGDHLIGIVSGPTVKLSQRHKILNREFERMMEVRLRQLECQMIPRSRGKRGVACRSIVGMPMQSGDSRRP